jgi:transcription elongation factor GreA
MTRAGYDKRKAELDHLQNVEMSEIEERIGRARAEGDLTENAEYQYAKESQGLLQAKINRLRDELSRAVLIDPSKVPRDEVAFGATILVRDLDLDEEEEFTLVGAGEEDYAEGKILVTSPLAQGLLGKRVGETAEIEVPQGTTRFEILKIQFDVS